MYTANDKALTQKLRLLFTLHIYSSSCLTFKDEKITTYVLKCS